MRAYFGDFKLLMQRAKDFGKPVMVLLEADAFGFLQQQSSSNPNARRGDRVDGHAGAGGPAQHRRRLWSGLFAAAQGGRRQQRGARHAHLGLGERQGHRQLQRDRRAQPEVDKVYNFLAPFGLAANVTGQQIRRAGRRSARSRRRLLPTHAWTRIAGGTPATAPRSRHAASTATRSGCGCGTSRRRSAGCCGRSRSATRTRKNVYNNGGPGQGYKDNRPEYFFGSGTAHIEKFADAGVIALLFGAGAGGQSSYGNDTYSDGQLFMKSRAGAIVNAGGVPLAGWRLAAAHVLARGRQRQRSHRRLLQRHDADDQGAHAHRRHGRLSWGTARAGRRRSRRQLLGALDRASQPALQRQHHVLHLVRRRRATVGQRPAVDQQLDQSRHHRELGQHHADGGPEVRRQARVLRGDGRRDRAATRGRSSCEPKAIVPASQLYPAAVATGDTARYNFESGAQSWVGSGSGVASAARSTDRAFAGTGSLKVVLGSAAGDGSVKVVSPAVPAGAHGHVSRLGARRLYPDRRSTVRVAGRGGRLGLDGRRGAPPAACRPEIGTRSRSRYRPTRPR